MHNESQNDDSGQEQPGESGKQQNLPVPAAAIERHVEKVKNWAAKAGNRFDALAFYIAPRRNESPEPESVARGPIIFGMLLIFLLFGIFGIWSTIAPIDSAAVATGKVIVDSNKKTIDHLEGGIIEDILVSEGMTVDEGQLLIRLDDTAPRARLDLYKGQFISAQATEARLIAERDNLDQVEFPETLLNQRDDPDVVANLDSQLRLFETRREAVDGRIKILSQKINQTQEEIKGLEQQIKSSDEQLALLSEEIADVRYLLKSGNAAKTRLLALERRAAEIRGQKAERQSLIARAYQTINEAKIEKYNIKTEFLNEVVTELRETQSTMSDLEEQMRAAQDVVKRIDIRAPIAGEVTGLNVHTIGGVIGPGQPIMDIVPSEDRLIVEARVKPQDIDVVRKGLTARVRLTAYKTRQVPPVEGTVTTVSADRLEDERTGEIYFAARVAIDDEELEKLEGNVKLSPGMPADVLIVTGSRTLFAYLMSPISESFNKAFREQ